MVVYALLRLGPGPSFSQKMASRGFVPIGNGAIAHTSPRRFELPSRKRAKTFLCIL